MTRTVIVWGCSSGAGKSWLATALCRWAARQGLDVAPFKAQNMSNNARVVATPDGRAGEIGAAQYFQALAARVLPQVDHNPVLLKPEHDTASQVVLHGEVAAGLSQQPWRERSAVLAAAARASFERLAARHELIVVEGAGSPAEINLADHDYVNLDTARWARAAGPTTALLVADIDRGGAFAHLHGTWALLPEDLRPLLGGFVLNKFRGDAALLAPGPEMLERLTGVPLAGVLPMWRGHGLPEEDGWFGREGGFSPREAVAPGALATAPRDGDAAQGSGRGPGPLRIAIVAFPRISNLDEFQPLAQAPGVELAWAREPSLLAAADWVVLPGSKQVSGDLAWLRERGLDRVIAAHAAAGRPVLGICGGLQMLGAVLEDPEGVDGAAHGPLAGLGLLPLHTRAAAPKLLRRTRLRFGAVQGPWAGLAGVEGEGYEIHVGRTEAVSGVRQGVLHDDAGQAIGWQAGPVLGVYAHGIFECAAVQQALFGREAVTLDARLDGLADAIERHLSPSRLAAWMKGP